MKTINIMPIRAGKTTQLLKEFRNHLESGGDGAFFTINYDQAYKLQADNPWLKGKIYSSDRFKNRDFGCGGVLNVKKKLFLDDYLFYERSTKEAIWNFYRHYDIVSNTTSNLLYNWSAVEFIKYIKRNKFIDEVYFLGAWISLGFVKLSFDEYYYNLITDNDCEVISNGLRSYERMIPRDVFETEIMGEWK